MMWVLQTFWLRPPLSLNQRLHWAKKAELVKSVREQGCVLARMSKIPRLEFVTVQMIWTVSTHHRRDTENPVPTLKAFCDGLVDAGIVPDDTPEFMSKPQIGIEYVKGKDGVRFELTGPVLEVAA